LDGGRAVVADWVLDRDGLWRLWWREDTQMALPRPQGHAEHNQWQVSREGA